MMGGYCPLDEPEFGYVWTTFYNRTGVEEALLSSVATGAPLSAELGGITTINSYPTSNASMHGLPIEIVMRLHVLRISEISQKTQTYKMHYTIKWVWRDCRLLMNCMYINLNDDNDLFTSFWKPRVRISEREDNSAEMKVERHMLMGHGWDKFTEEHVSHFRCSFDFTDMPYDEQDCKLTFFLPDEPSWFITLSWNGLDGEELTNAEWELTQPREWTLDHQLAELDHVTGETTSSQLVAGFKLRRRPAFLVNNYLVHASMFYLLSWVGLWIDVGAVPARAAVGVIPVLVTSNKMSALSASIPPISYSTRLADFMQLTLAMITMHMLEYGVVHFATRRHKLLSERVKKSEQVMQDNTEADRSREPSRLIQMEIAVMNCITRYLEMAARVLSPLIYAVAAAVILQS